MSAYCSKTASHSYFVVMIDFGKRGLEAVVQPELTRRDIVDRLVSGEYQNVAFIHHIDDMMVEDLTLELLNEAEAICRRPMREVA